MNDKNQISHPNLVEESRKLFPPAFNRTASEYLLEEEHKISQAISIIIPRIWRKLIDIVSHNSGIIRLDEILSYHRKVGFIKQSSSFFDLSSGYWLNQGARFSSMLFGKEQGKLIEQISRKSLLKISSSTILLSTCTPAIIGLLSEKYSVNRSGLGAVSELVNMQSIFLPDDSIDMVTNGGNVVAITDQEHTISHGGKFVTVPSDIEAIDNPVGKKFLSLKFLIIILVILFVSLSAIIIFLLKGWY